MYLARNWRGGADNQQGWYAQFYNTMSASPSATWHISAVSDDNAHSGSQSAKMPVEEYYYNYIHHDFEKKTEGVLTFECYYWLDHIVLDMNLCNNIFILIDDYASRTSTGDPVGDYQWGEHHTPYHTVHPVGSPNWFRDNAGFVCTHANVSDDDRWIGMRMSFDMDKQKYAIWTDADDDGAWLPVDFGGGVYWADFAAGFDGGLSCIAFYQLCSGAYFTGNTDVYIDDIRVTWDIPALGTVVIVE